MLHSIEWLLKLHSFLTSFRVDALLCLESSKVSGWAFVCVRSCLVEPCVLLGWLSTFVH